MTDERVAHVIQGGQQLTATHPREIGDKLAASTAITPDDIAVDAILAFFAYAHLPEPLQAISRIFADAAAATVHRVPRSPERTVALRKLLEAKDAAVRAALPTRS